MNNLYKANVNYTQNRGDNTPHNNKLGFKKIKHNTIQSLTEVSCFFDNFSHFMKYVKLYKFNSF